MATKTGKIRMLIAAKEREKRDNLRRILAKDDRYEIAGIAIDGMEAVQLAVLLKPDVALLDVDIPIFNGMDAAQMINLAAPEVKSVLVGNGEPDEKLLNMAMASGLRAYVPQSAVETGLVSKIGELVAIDEKRNTSDFRTATDPRLLPKIIVVTGGKGGIGKTTISVSLAACLARIFPGKVVLFDLYTQFGDVSTVLNINPKRSLAELGAAAEDIDIETLESCMVDTDEGIRVLVASTRTGPLDSISVSVAESVLHALKRKYTYIIIDLPPILHPTTLYVVSNCYKMFIITNMFDMPTLRNAKELYERISDTYLSSDKIEIIANRVSKFDRLRVNDVERTLGREVSAKLPNDPRLVSAVNQGVPFIQAYSKSPLVGAVEGIVNDFILQDSINLT